MKQIIPIFLLYLGVANSLKCDNFECIPGLEQKVNVSGNVLKCPDDQICNSNTCTKPCVTCSDIYECDPTNSEVVIIDGIEMLCLDGLTCNSEYELPCKPCIKKQCEKPQNFKCISDTEINVENVLLKCDSGFMCNHDYKYPCTPCIKEEININVTTTTLPETVPTTVITTTSLPEISTTINPEDIICKQGSGTCLYAGPDVYYRCLLVWWWYEKVRFDCTNKLTDKYCSNATNICT